MAKDSVTSSDIAALQETVQDVLERLEGLEGLCQDIHDAVSGPDVSTPAPSAPAPSAPEAVPEEDEEGDTGLADLRAECVSLALAVLKSGKRDGVKKALKAAGGAGKVSDVKDQDLEKFLLELRRLA